MTIRIKGVSENGSAGLIVCICAPTLAGTCHAQATARKDALTCPFCACEPVIAKTKGDTKSSNIGGCILGADQSKERIRVRILGVHSSELVVTRANSAGQFSFNNVPDGDYMLVATQNQKVLALTAIRLPSHIPIVVDVEPFRTDLPRLEY